MDDSEDGDTYSNTAPNVVNIVIPIVMIACFVFTMVVLFFCKWEFPVHKIRLPFEKSKFLQSHSECRIACVPQKTTHKHITPVDGNDVLYHSRSYKLMNNKGYNASTSVSPTAYSQDSMKEYLSAMYWNQHFNLGASETVV